MSSNNGKSAIRKEISGKRLALSAGEVGHRSQRVFDNFLAHIDEILPAQYSTVALYYPIRGEVDTRPFFRFFRSRSKTILFPKIERGELKPLSFYPVRDLSDLQLGPLGICEPALRPGQSSQIPDVVIVPGLAFSEDGFRVGYGGGHYDCTADSWTQAGSRAKVTMVAIAYDFQLISEPPSESHDHHVDFVVTEEKFFRGRPR